MRAHILLQVVPLCPQENQVLGKEQGALHNSSCLVCACILLAAVSRILQGMDAWPFADLSWACPSLYVLCGGHACQFSYTGWLSCVSKGPVNWCRMLSSKRLWGCTGTLLRRKVALTRQQMQSLQRTGSKGLRRRGAWATKPDRGYRWHPDLMANNA